MTDEKDLPTFQSPAHPDPRISRPHGHPGRAQSSKTPTHQGTQTSRNLDSGQTARVARKRGPESFSAADRLHLSAEYRHLQRHGYRAASAHFVVYAGSVHGDIENRPRLGITVSKRIGNAVIRNRVKRRLREIFRHHLRAMLPEGSAMVVIARAGAGALESSSIASELTSSVGALARRFASRAR